MIIWRERGNVKELKADFSLTGERRKGEGAKDTSCFLTNPILYCKHLGVRPTYDSL